MHASVHEALFIVAKEWKQPKCPSTDEWIMKMWYGQIDTHMHIYIYTHTKCNITQT